IRRTAGLAGVERDERIFSGADVESFTNAAIGAAIFGIEGATHFGRVVGNSMARIAEAAASLFLVTVERPLVEDGAGELELIQAQAQGIELLDIVPRMMETLFRAHMMQVIRRGHADEHGGDTMPTLAVGFVDLVGFTPLSQTLDTERLMRLVNE